MPTTLSDRFVELVLNDKRFRIAAGVCGGVVLLISMILLGLSSRPMHKASTQVVSALPDQPYNIRILRSLPDPQPMLPKAGRAIVSAQGQASGMLARRH